MSSNNTAVLENGHKSATARCPRQIYDWANAGERGELKWLHKDMLNVDHTYQRRSINQERVNNIARAWNWPALLAIGVCQRQDGSYWVYDGQHRVLAAKKRDDIFELPCIVHRAATVAAEAGAFVVGNSVRGAMKRLDKYRAELVAGDPAALAVEELVEMFGYRVAAGAQEGTVSCVEALHRACTDNFAIAKDAFSICATIAGGRTFSAKLFSAMCYLEEHLRRYGLSITDPNNRDKLCSTDADGLLSVIMDSERYHKKSGRRVGAQGLVQFINKGRRTKNIPVIFS